MWDQRLSFRVALSSEICFLLEIRFHSFVPTVFEYCGEMKFFSIPVFRLFSVLLKTELSRMSKVYSLFLHSIFDNFDRSRKLLFDFGRLPKFSDGSIHCRTLESVIGLFRPYSQHLFDVSSRKLLSLRSFLFERLRSRRSLWPIFLISIIVYTISIVFKYSWYFLLT